VVTRTATIAVLVVGCGADAIVIAPVIDSPPEGSDAAAFPDLDMIELSVAVDGDPDVLVAEMFFPGDRLELPGVPYGENLVVHMRGWFSGDEVAYGRTCRFAVRPDETPPTPHLYFAETGKWAESATPPMAVRIGGAALTHRDGSGVYLGGLADQSPVAAVDRFDALAGSFDTVASLATRSGAAAARLGDGRIVIAGGIDQSTLAPATYIELVQVDADPDNRVEQQDAGPLVAKSLVLASLADGRIVAIGGQDALDAPLGQLVEIAIAGATTTFRILDVALTTPRHGHTATRLSDDLGAPVLIVGGKDAAGVPVATAELFRPLDESIAPGFSPPMIVPRYGHQVVRLPDGSLLVIGGRDAAGTPVRTLERFTLEGGFVPATTLPLPATAGVNLLSVTPLPDGQILLAGGVDQNETRVFSSFVAQGGFVSGSINILASHRLPSPRAGHQATVLCDGTVMLVGGSDSAEPALRYNPTPVGRGPF
jgi:hypothetical protein